MKILFVTSEAAPFVKTGGLGDVAYALPTELAKDPEQEVAVILPYYRQIKYGGKFQIDFVTSFGVRLAWRELHCGVFRGTLPGSRVVYYFLDNEYYFCRDGGIYGHYDDGERFAFFSRAVLDTISHIGYFPDILHCNDWQTAMVPIFLKSLYCSDWRYQKIKTVFTIHNIEYQGRMPNEFMQDVLGLPEEWRPCLTFMNCINFMKGAIVLADKVSTVSRTYSFEIRHAYFAHTLEHILEQYSYKLCGIVNGIDTVAFDPRTDKYLAKNYSPRSPGGKAECKRYLQEKLGLPQNPDIPIVGMVTRLVAHKGLDLVECVAGELMNLPMQLVVVGTGDRRYEDLFHRLKYSYPDKIADCITFDSALASEVYAGSDFFLMPSKSEPCGLSQLIAMRYGTIPIVRETGGLVDTVPPLNVDTLEGRGFTFKLFNAHDMLGAVKRALMFYNDKDKLRKVSTALMKIDSSWAAPVQEYLGMYRDMLR